MWRSFPVGLAQCWLYHPWLPLSLFYSILYITSKPTCEEMAAISSPAYALPVIVGLIYNDVLQHWLKWFNYKQKQPTQTNTLHAPRSTLHAPRSTLHAPRSTLHAPRSTLHAPRSTLHAARSTLQAPSSKLQAPSSASRRSLNLPPSNFGEGVSQSQAGVIVTGQWCHWVINKI